ncbi:MAG: hypothetical protein JNJ77_14375 [Planctomycetia bacterium]|nr:hypothetical protein [Planctomycetia bacterium]
MRYLAVASVICLFLHDQAAQAQVAAVPATPAVPLKTVQTAPARVVSGGAVVQTAPGIVMQPGAQGAPGQAAQQNFVPQIKTVEEIPQLFLPAGQVFIQAVEQSQRMQRLKQLQFSRKPTAILKAWNPAMGDIKPNIYIDPQIMMMRGGMPMMHEPDMESNKAVKTPEQKRLDEQMERFQSNVTLGNWSEVRRFMQSLTGPETRAAYRQMLRSLASTQMSQAEMQAQNTGRPVLPQTMEKNVFYTEDLIQLVSLVPEKLDKEHLRNLTSILKQSLASGNAPETVVEKLKQETSKPKEKRLISEREVSKLLVESDLSVYLKDFLPSPDEAFQSKDLEALNLLARYYIAKHAQEPKSKHLEDAWKVTLQIMSLKEGDKEEKLEALKRAVEYAPRIKEELGQRWLEESFTTNTERGKEILSTLGTYIAQGMLRHPQDSTLRLKELQLQKSAIAALLKSSPTQAREWAQTLTLLASNWMREAEFSKQYDFSSNYGPRARRDVFGNFYYVNVDDDGNQQMMWNMRQQGIPQAIATGELLRTSPDDQWLTYVDAGLRPKLSGTLAQLHLKVGEENKAFPHIQSLAKSNPNQAKELVKEFLKVWTRNHDPNSERNQYRSMYFFYGYEERAEGIPLTRSKQERNVKELSEVISKMREMNLGDVDEEQLSKAFTTCHSAAEVYKTEAIEKVFGPLGKLKPRTFASLAQTMRGNLTGLWKNPGVQEKNKTNRKQKDIQEEVLRGYEVAKQVIEDGLKQHPNHWALLTAKAAVLHDEVNYRSELGKSSEFSAQRSQALKVFAQAAEQYDAVLRTRSLPEDEETTMVYDQWFYASLGAVDLAMINEERQPDFKQMPIIKAAIQKLPADLAERHMNKFANNLFSRMSSAKAQVKFRYLQGGFGIIDPDHKQAYEARKLFDYYKDLITEVKLTTEVDGGDTTVGHGEPFGVFVHLLHTRDIERESGGFSRYLQNQNSLRWSYNYGRPTADYRDRFETAVKETLKEQFDIISVTFESEKVHSRSAREFGWRVTPYAYLLLKAKGPQVDKLPGLRIDLDFLDTSGFVVLPVESPVLPIDCKPKMAKARPVRKLTITQTLDERQASKGKLILEVKATGLGLVPPIPQLLDIRPAGFEIAKLDDQGVAIAKFSEDQGPIAIQSDRTALVTLVAHEGQAAPKTFQFGKPLVENAEVIYQRYNDADLVSVTQSIELDQKYGNKSMAGTIWLIGSLLATLLTLGVIIYLIRRKRPVTVDDNLLPEHMTAFTVHQYLDRLRSAKHLPPALKEQLETEIASIERDYFSAERNGHAPADLRQLALKWMNKAKQRI